MPYRFVKQKCKQADGDSGKYVVYKKDGDKKVGCTNSPEEYRKALHAAEGGYIKKESTMDMIKKMIIEEIKVILEKKKMICDGSMCNEVHKGVKHEEYEKKRLAEKKKSSGKKDACYYKVKARYDAFPSAYASGALVKCRKVGAKNWGNSSK